MHYLKFSQWFLFISIFFFSFGNSAVEAQNVQDFFTPSEAENYHKNSKLQWNLAMDALSHYPLKGNERVLDVGCGDGKITAYMAKILEKGSVVGLDISLNMIEFAMKKFPRSQYPNMCFIVGNGKNLPNYHEYDTVVAFCSLNWMPNQLKALKGMRDSLKDKGSMLIVVPAPMENDLFGVISSLLSSNKWKVYLKKLPYYNNAEDYKRMVLEAGFHSVEVNAHLVETVFDNEEELRNCFTASISTLKNFSLQKQSEFLQDYVRAVIARFPPDKQGRIHVFASCFEIYAQKKINHSQ